MPQITFEMLPNELISHIFSFLPAAAPRNALVRTNRRLYLLLNRSLYKAAIDSREPIRYRAKKRCELYRWAIITGHGEILSRLFSYNLLSVETCQPSGVTLLMMAVMQDQHAVASVLLAHGADPQRTRPGGDTALHCCRSAGMVRLLLDHGADLEKINREKMSPLHVFVRKGLGELVEVLLSRGATHSCMDLYGDTPLHTAIQNSDATTTLALLKHGAKLSTVNSFGWTPLHMTPYGWDGLLDDKDEDGLKQTLLLLMSDWRERADTSAR